MQSEGGGDPEASEELRKERAEAWKQARQARRRFVHLGHCRMSSKMELQSYWERTPVYAFQGRPGETHRVFVFSAELSAEAESTP